MEQLLSFLFGYRNDVFKLLPMKEDELDGAENYIPEYIDSLIVSGRGAMREYPELSTRKQFIEVINNLNYLAEEDMTFPKWRKIVLSSVSKIGKIYASYGGRDERG